MGQQMPGLGQIPFGRGHNHLDHVALIIAELRDMAQPHIRQQAVRQSLAAPVDRQDIIAGIRQKGRNA